jgi:hypothetical protein
MTSKREKRSEENALSIFDSSKPEEACQQGNGPLISDSAKSQAAARTGSMAIQAANAYEPLVDGIREVRGTREARTSPVAP